MQTGKNFLNESLFTIFIQVTKGKAETKRTRTTL